VSASRRAALRLRPMDYGDILDFSIKIYARHFGVLLGAFALPYLPVQFVAAYWQMSVTAWSATGPTPEEMTTLLATVFVTLVGHMIAYPFALAATTQGISEAYLGQKPTLRSCYAGVGRRFWPLLAAVVGSSVLIAGGFLLLIVGGIYLMIVYLFVAQAVVLENESWWGALGRSAALVKGYFGKCLVVVLLVWLIISVISWALVMPLQVLVQLSMFQQGGVPSLPLQAANVGVSSLVSLLLGPFQIIARTLLYYDLRIRREGFDLQVMARELGLAETVLVPCPHCGARNAPEANFCGQCGGDLRAAGQPSPLSAPGQQPSVACAQCGAANAPEATFCGQCGARLASQPPPPL